MAPIYESDVAEERWAKAEWNQYELWERVELRLLRHKRIWIGATVAVFLLISSIPIVIGLRPKWAGLSAARVLAQEINSLKRDASLDHGARRIRFEADGSLRFVIEKLENCAADRVAEVRRGALMKESQLSSFALLNPARAEEAGIPGLVTSYCYDPLSTAAPDPSSISGFGIIPANDLTVARFDRLSLLLLSGGSADISFE